MSVITRGPWIFPPGRNGAVTATNHPDRVDHESSIEADGLPSVVEDIDPGVIGGPPDAELRAVALIRRTFALGLAGVLAGFVVGGLGGRIAMRISAIAAGDRLQGVTTDAGFRVGEITLGGTIELVVFGGVLSGAAGVIVIGLSREWLPKVLPGIVTGLFLLAVTGSLIIEADSRDFLILDPALLNIVMFAGLIVLFGTVVVPLSEVIERRLARSENPSSAYGLLIPLLLGSLLAIPIFGSLLFEGFCECDDPPVTMGVFFLLAAAATLLTWLREVRRGGPPRLWVRIGGWVGVSGATLFGAVRLFEEIERIL